MLRWSWCLKCLLRTNTCVKKTGRGNGQRGGIEVWFRLNKVLANQAESFRVNITHLSWPPLGQKGQTFISSLHQSQDWEWSDKAWPCARWLSAKTADSEGVDSCRFPSDCTPCSWSASLSLKEEWASAFLCFPSSSGQQNGAHYTEEEWSQEGMVPTHALHLFIHHSQIFTELLYWT